MKCGAHNVVGNYVVRVENKQEESHRNSREKMRISRVHMNLVSSSMNKKKRKQIERKANKCFLNAKKYWRAEDDNGTIGSARALFEQTTAKKLLRCVRHSVAISRIKCSCRKFAHKTEWR